MSACTRPTTGSVSAPGILKSPRKAGQEEIARINLRFDELLAGTNEPPVSSKSAQNGRVKEPESPRSKDPATSAKVKETAMSPRKTEPSMGLLIKEPSMSPRMKEPSMSPRIKEPSISPRPKDSSVSPRIKEPSMSPRIKEPSMSPRIKEPLSVGVKAVSPTRDRKDKSVSPRGALSPDQK